MTHLKEAEPCSEKEAKVRCLDHCRVFSVLMWGKCGLSSRRDRNLPHSLTSPRVNIYLLWTENCQVFWESGFCRAVHTHSYQELRTNVWLFTLMSHTHACTYSLFKPLLRFVQVQSWSRSLVYTLEELECKICYNRYDSHSRKPKLLGCLHRVCAKCLKKMVNIGECAWLEIILASPH